jgi:hypothetical protein
VPDPTAHISTWMTGISQRTEHIMVRASRSAP